MSLKNVPPNVQPLISRHLNTRNRRLLNLALSNTQSAAAKRIQHAWKQFKSSQLIGRARPLKPIHINPSPKYLTRENLKKMARQLGIQTPGNNIVGLPNKISALGNYWKGLARLPREERRRETGLGPVYTWRGLPRPQNVRRVTVPYSTHGESVPFTSELIKSLHRKNNQELKNYVKRRYPTYKRAANDFGKIDAYMKKWFKNYQTNRPVVKLLYPRLKKNWWPKTNGKNNNNNMHINKLFKTRNNA
jgi:hypothetical protein